MVLFGYGFIYTDDDEAITPEDQYTLDRIARRATNIMNGGTDEGVGREAVKPHTPWRSPKTHDEAPAGIAVGRP